MDERTDTLATRASYDAVAEDYEEQLRSELDAKPLDRALLTAFAELAAVAGDGRIADLGCGPGRVSGFLSSTGADVFGIDLSPGMVAVARRAHPGISFDVGSMEHLDLPDGLLGGVLAWYSTIHTPDDRLPGVLAEFRRVLAPGGSLLLAFQAGDRGKRHIASGYGHQVSITAYDRSPEQVSALLSAAGLETVATTVRSPEPPEPTRQAYVLARRPPGPEANQDEIVHLPRRA